MSFKVQKPFEPTKIELCKLTAQGNCLGVSTAKPKDLIQNPHVKKLVKTTEIMIARAGNPDPKEACRLVVKTGNEALAEFGAE